MFQWNCSINIDFRLVRYDGEDVSRYGMLVYDRLKEVGDDDVEGTQTEDDDSGTSGFDTEGWNAVDLDAIDYVTDAAEITTLSGKKPAIQEVPKQSCHQVPNECCRQVPAENCEDDPRKKSQPVS